MIVRRDTDYPQSSVETGASACARMFAFNQIAFAPDSLDVVPRAAGLREEGHPAALQVHRHPPGGDAPEEKLVVVHPVGAHRAGSGAVETPEAGGLAVPLKIKVRSTAGEKFDRIVSYTLGQIPESVDSEMGIPLSEIPF